MRRVVITGVGVVSAIGLNATEFWSALSAGRSGIVPITRVDVSNMRFQKAAEIRGFEPEKIFDEKFLFWLDPFAQYGIAAAREAVTDSGLEFTAALKDASGVITGSSLGGKPTEDEQYRKLYAEGK